MQIVLQARRDPHNLGYVYLETVEGNTTRYTTGLDVKNTNWTKLQSGAVGTAASQTGEPTIHNPTASPSGAGGECQARPSGLTPGSVLDRPPRGAVGQTTEREATTRRCDAQRDTLFHAGRSDRYGGDVDLTISLTTTWQPSTLANSAAAEPAAHLRLMGAEDRQPSPGTKIAPSSSRSRSGSSSRTA